MGLIRLFAMLSAILVISVEAQTKLTIDDAINLAYQNNLELFNQKIKINFADSELDESGRLPNPSFSYAREDLSATNVKVNEWSALGSVPINFLWDRWGKIDSREKRVNAQKLLLKNLKVKTANKVKHVYNSLHHYSELSYSFQKVLERLSELKESSKNRFEVGDISEYEFKRIVLEFNKVKSVVTDIELSKIRLENELRLLIGLNKVEQISTTIISNFVELNFDENELIEMALKNRKDILAYSQLFDSEKSNLSSQGIMSIPAINLTAGYKQQSDNLKGSVFQLDFELPIFNRNQTKIEQSKIELSIYEKELFFLKEKIRVEVSESFKSYKLNKQLYDDTKNLNLESIFSVSDYSYEQGEFSIVEFVDGINAFVDGMQLSKQNEINYQKSIFDLEQAIGGSFIVTIKN